MDHSEQLNPIEKERVDLYQSKNPFKGIEPGITGKYTSKTFDFAGIGDLVFYASPNITQVDTKKYFQNPRRIWAELSFPEGTTQEDVDRITLGLAINVQVWKNQSVTLHAEVVNEQKVTFNMASRPYDQVTQRNPLIEDTSFLPQMVIEVTDDVAEEQNEEIS